MAKIWSWVQVDSIRSLCVVSFHQRAVVMAASSTLQEDQVKQKQRIEASKLYINVSPDEKDPVVYSSSYNVSFLGIEKLHPFDASKWSHVQNFLSDDGVLKQKRIVEPVEATRDDLLVVHTEKYLDSLNSSYVVAQITEVAPVAFLPNFLVQWKLLHPFRKQVGGTVLSAKLAKERGWAINIGGGFHHCCANEGGGFCAYADITLAIQFAYTRLAISRVIIIDLDAHQGNGHERDFTNDDRVYIIDMYNEDIYPQDFKARKRINQAVALKSGTKTDRYLALLSQELKKAATIFKPELVVYNAGTDVLEGDPLGRLLVSPEGVKQRDEMVFRFAKDQKSPIIMLTSGGYMKTSARVIADSIKNLAAKRLISLPSGSSGSSS
ncbi:histone deacetylase 2 isoform X1 [Physcomitrium patens]|uniref:histone deacetylase n=2 Tax=Physcomitrium patens TaxID=3218 RepID=A0A2K1KH05_PHYPA|nr:histone deacetylase 2-like isoform X1 [Physcomitrium patens]XP_024378462.1 histone deacetylase 2-like isoform X1 [Physcomitrium patens]PNR53057.1 hypothetical protein PHYPA_009432 [Physcomitrium patens]|eukprot:XP_024378461.1 histone deacetylase 2-like isoform X1 [Physcomitrella patens]